MKPSIQNALLEATAFMLAGFLVIAPVLIVLLVIAALFKYVFGHG